MDPAIGATIGHVLLELLLLLPFLGVCGAAMGVMVSRGLPASWLQDPEEPARQRIASLEALGLTRTPSQGWHGTIDGFEVFYRLSTIYRPGGWGVGVALGTLEVSLELPLRRQEVQIGDLAFDERFHLRGEPADLARLTASVRAELMRMVGPWRVWLQDGAVWVDSGDFQRDLERAFGLARQLSQLPSDPEERLIAIVTSDPLPDVRQHVLGSLSSQEASLAARVALAARFDPALHVRAEAALLLGDPELLVEMATEESLSLDRRARAASRLGVVGSDAHRLALGERLAREPALSLKRQAVALLQSVGEAGCAALIELLPTRDPDLLVLVVEALGEVGTIEVVSRLRARQDALSRMQSALWAAIDRAICQIQASTGGEHGGLALVTSAPEGSLALAGVAGALAVSPMASSQQGG